MDPVGLSSALQSLQGGLIPTAMDAGWGSFKGKWIKNAKTKPAWEDALSTLAK
jgi:hypothetical protein